MGLFQVSLVGSKSLARLPALPQIYHQHLIHFIQFPVYSTLTFIEVFDMQVDDVTDGVVEHVEARGFFDHIGRFGNIDQVKNRCQNFIHSLYVLNLGVELRIDVEYASHVVIPICLSLFFFAVQELLVGQLVIPIDQFEFFATGTGQVRNHDITARHGEEGKLCMGSGRIFLNLFPKHIILLKLLVPRVVFLQDKRIIGKFRLRQEHLDQSLISLGLIFNVLFPQIFFRWQIFQYEFPAILTYVGSLIRYTFGQAFFESLHIDDTGVEDIDEIGNFFTDDWRHSFGCESIAFSKRFEF